MKGSIYNRGPRAEVVPSGTIQFGTPHTEHVLGISKYIAWTKYGMAMVGLIMKLEDSSFPVLPNVTKARRWR